MKRESRIALSAKNAWLTARGVSQHDRGFRVTPWRAVTSRSLLPALPSIGRMTDARAVADATFRALPFGGKALALLLSVSAHAALALAFAHGAPRAALHSNLPREALVEIAALDFALPDAPADLAHAPSATLVRPHSHPYPVPPDHDVTPHDPSLNHLQPTSDGTAAPAAAPTVLDSPAPAAPRFVMTMGSVRAPGGTSAVDGRAGIPSSSASSEPTPEAAVDTSATLLTGNSPSYTPEAQAAGVEADVPLEIVVDAAGAVISARALAHVGYGLDEAALRGVRAYRFSPARRAGTPLAVRMRWLMRFQLR
jgi:protein TonB